MKNTELKETIRNIVDKVLAETETSPSKPSTSPEPTIAPDEPREKPGPRRPLGNPDVKPKPKATMSEDNEIIKKIVDRFKSKHQPSPINESKTWEEGYKEGYEEGYNSAKNNKPNKFSK